MPTTLTIIADFHGFCIACKTSDEMGTITSVDTSNPRGNWLMVNGVVGRLGNWDVRISLKENFVVVVAVFVVRSRFIGCGFWFGYVGVVGLVSTAVGGVDVVTTN